MPSFEPRIAASNRSSLRRRASSALSRSVTSMVKPTISVVAPAPSVNGLATLEKVRSPMREGNSTDSPANALSNAGPTVAINSGGNRLPDRTTDGFFRVYIKFLGQRALTVDQAHLPGFVLYQTGT